MEQRPTSHFAFGPRNYRLMFIGLAMLVAGFITMTLDTADYGLGFLGITLGPILLVVGFIIEFFAIMAKPGGQSSTPAETISVEAASTASVSPPVVAPTPAARPTYKR
ncbi:DUF3098 domain-containing protein [Hymenobacter qilianensis]|uniref:DUF3098 domain-containing protein n=2 Tax=Hymenobacter qilianensis TaxID=1385715 RepID=A0A7H0GRM8_9BACT|nr:DUF3098 domain-containing protein [Hymenobacter qilianensis]QNP50944.1 DUF3098 domain-containing protein [Hymenobacter qilianensis]